MTRSPTAKRASSRSGFDHHAGSLDAHDRVRVGVQAQRDHDVAEVGGDGRQRDADPAGLQRGIDLGVGNGFQTKVVERAMTAHRRAATARRGRHQQTADSTAAVYPHGVDRSAAEHNLRLTYRQRRGHRRIIQRRITIDEHDPAGMLGLRRAHQTPDRRTRQIGDVLARQRHRAPGRNHQRRRGVAVQPRLQHGQCCAGGRVHVAHDVTSHWCRFEQIRRGLGSGRCPGPRLRSLGPSRIPDTGWISCGGCADQTTSKRRSGPEFEIAASSC